MIEAKNLDLATSYGDTFAVRFNFPGYTASDTDIFRFSIKKTEDDSELMLTEDFTSAGNTYVDVSISAAKMKGLAIGNYYYDLMQVNGDNRRTLFFPAKFAVKGVAHLVD